MDRYQGEEVAVVDRVRLDERGWDLHGLHPLAPDEVAWLESIARYELRCKAEETEAWLQLIPYVCVRRGDDIFAMRRLAGGGETRLVGKSSVGVGGHINPVDGAHEGLVARAMARELWEEVGLPPNGATLVARIHDATIEVGRVHLGIAWVLDVDADADVRIREQGKLSGAFEPLDALLQAPDALETWSLWLAQFLASRRNSVIR